jgi:hypothetical protein
MTIMIAGSPDDFTVRIGIGKWLEHLAVAAIETLLISDLFLVVDVAEIRLELRDRGQARQGHQVVRRLTGVGSCRRV